MGFLVRGERGFLVRGWMVKLGFSGLTVLPIPISLRPFLSLAPSSAFSSSY